MQGRGRAFALNRLAPASRSRLKLAAAMGLSDHAVFEFQVGNWLADNNNGPATMPEVEKIKGAPFLCITAKTRTTPSARS